MNDIVIVGGARDYHAMDWYRTVRKNALNRRVLMLTDSIEGEGYIKIVTKDDEIEKLFIIDNFLFSKQSSLGNLWRNIFKLIVLPLQIYKLKKFFKLNSNSIYHAHPMYYMLLCWLSGINYIGSPQGDEVLIRPKNSKFYRYFAKKVLQNAKYIIVDSMNMKNEIYELSGVQAIIYQYGIDVEKIKKYTEIKINKNKITSIRAMLSLYRINKIVESRNYSNQIQGINYIYPFYEDAYVKNIRKEMTKADLDLGRLNKEDMYDLMVKSYLIISIPKSDSSPRSVYEAIFLGCCVAVTYNVYIESLPQCMKNRLYIVNLDDIEWFSKAVEYAKSIVNKPYVPSLEALEMFDQNISISKVIEKLYV